MLIGSSTKFTSVMPILLGSSRNLVGATSGTRSEITPAYNQTCSLLRLHEYGRNKRQEKRLHQRESRVALWKVTRRRKSKLTVDTQELTRSIALQSHRCGIRQDSVRAITGLD